MLCDDGIAIHCVAGISWMRTSQSLENMKVGVFTGGSCNGKSTEINAFISYLLQGDLDDRLRLMVVDDKKAGEDIGDSVSEYVTCYRI